MALFSKLLGRVRRRAGEPRSGASEGPTGAFTARAVATGWSRQNVFPTESALLRSQRLRAVALGTLGVVTVALLALLVIEPGTTGRRLGSLLVAWLIVGVILSLNRRGHTAFASWVFVFGLIALVTQRAWITGGIYAPVLPFYVVFVMMGGVLLSRMGGLVTTLACLAGAAVLIAGQRAGLVTPVHDFASPFGMFVFLTMILGLSLVLQAMIGDAFRASLTRAEREIAEREGTQTRLDLAMDAAKISVWEIDRINNRMLTDRRMGELYDVSIAGDGTVPLDDILARIHEDDLQSVLARRENVNELSQTVQHSHRVVRPDGSIRYVRGASVTVEGEKGRGTRIVGVSMDVTELARVQFEREHLVHDLGERVKELRLLHLVAQTTQRTWISDTELLQDIVNAIPPAWQFPEITVGRITLGEIAVTSPGWRETEWMQSTQFVAGEQIGSIDVAYTKQCPPEDEGPFLKEERALIDSLAEMLVSHLESMRSRQELESLVEIRTAQLRTARDAAEQAAKAKGAFLANMSHEIRTPMNAILGYEQLLQAEPNLTDAQRGKLDVIRTSGDHLLTLINDILDMSRLEAGRTALSVQPFDLYTLMDGVQSMFVGQAAKRGITLSMQMDTAVPRGVNADPGKVRQVMINLIGNAVKFTDTGSVRINVRAVPAAESQCLVTIDVEDTGPGIDSSSFDLIFSPFGQAREGAARGGTGLGLSISRSFARLMDGDITVRSTKGSGSTFTFTFACAIVETDLATAVPSQEVRRRLAPAETRRRVLIVDDVPTNRNLLHELLTRGGFETQSAASGEDALIEHGVWHPDLIVMDLHMPGIGGFEALRLLRARGAATPVIISTASTDPASEAQVFAVGAQRLLVKPYREHQLFDAIADVMSVAFVNADKTPRPVQAPVSATQLRKIIGEIPGSLIEELREAARKARAARVLELASEIEIHSPAAAQGIRQFAEEFRYAALLDALKESTADA